MDEEVAGRHSGGSGERRSMEKEVRMRRMRGRWRERRRLKEEAGRQVEGEKVKVGGRRRWWRERERGTGTLLFTNDE